MKTFRGSTTEIANLIKCSYGEANALIAVLVAKGIAKEVGKRPNPTGRGKGSTLFEIPNEVNLMLWD